MSTRLLTALEAADVLRCTVRQLWDMPIPKVRLGKRAYRYDPRDLVKAGLMPDPSIKSWVYFVGYREHVKIGVAKNWKARTSCLQTGSPVKLTVLGVMPGDVLTERKLHNQFADRRMNGEWFLISDEIREFIKANCSRVIT